MAVIVTGLISEEQPHAVSEGRREHRTMRRSGPATEANKVGRG
ncbi:MAG: hypothetical protein A4E38_01339 [Methanoregulaceae archaeon PtaB.Bin108]|nr:MAG: hypothetical protein A4E38_01339 [Methanoregulaceae archaeon PtaB.Bin108]